MRIEIDFTLKNTSIIPVQWQITDANRISKYRNQYMINIVLICEIRA